MSCFCGTKLDCRLLYTSCELWAYVFGGFLLAIEATNLFIFMLFISAPALTYYMIQKVAIPPPDPSMVNEVLGKEIKPERLPFDKTFERGCDRELEQDEDEGLLMSMIAHRFAGLDAPENTLEALDLCYKNGAVGVEFDLNMCKDYVPVIFHDDKLDRVSIATGDLDAKKWNEVKDLDVSVSHPFHERYHGSKIPLFEDIIERCIEYDMRMFIDIKDDKPEVAKSVLDMYKKHPILYRRAVVSSFNFWVIYNIRRRDPNIVGGMAYRPHYLTYETYSANEEECVPYYQSPFMWYLGRLFDFLHYWFFINVCWYITGISTVLLCKDIITPNMVSHWRKRKIRTYAWTVNKPLEKLHLIKNLGVGILTDTMIGK